MHGLFPHLAFKKIVGIARVFCSQPRASEFGAQTTAQKTFEERVQTILFAALV